MSKTSPIKAYNGSAIASLLDLQLDEFLGDVNKRFPHDYKCDDATCRLQKGDGEMYLNPSKFLDASNSSKTKQSSSSIS